MSPLLLKSNTRSIYEWIYLNFQKGCLDDGRNNNRRICGETTSFQICCKHCQSLETDLVHVFNVRILQDSINNCLAQRTFSMPEFYSKSPYLPLNASQAQTSAMLIIRERPTHVRIAFSLVILASYQFRLEHIVRTLLCFD